MLCLACGSLPAPVWAENVIIDAGVAHQSIRGFGASSAWRGTLTTAQANLLWRADTGIGLSMLRHRIPPDRGFDSGVSILKQARDRGVRQIWATEWSPPAKLKTNGSLINGGTLLHDRYQDYATYLADYAATLRDMHGITLFAISPFNEPDISTTYESCLMSGTQIAEFVRYYLGPTLARRGLKTRVVIPEPTGAFRLPAWADASLNDPATASYVFAVGTHIYGGLTDYPLAAGKGKEYWQTEISDYLSPADGGMRSGLQTALWIHGSLVTGGMNAFHYWWLHSVAADNQGLLDSNGKATKRLYVMGNFSKFVRPGARRIAATPSPAPGVLVSAFLQPEGHLAVVAVNRNTSAVTQTFQFVGPSVKDVTPWITDATRNLAAQSPLPVDQQLVTFELPAESVTTLVSIRTTPLRVTVRGAGGVTSEPAGIDCPPACESEFPRGSTVKLSATAAPPHAFLNWRGDQDCADGQVKASLGVTCVATFQAVRCKEMLATIVGTRGSDVILGTQGRDVIVGLEGNDKIHGRAGNDLICGGPGDDRLSGGDGNDRVEGGTGRDLIDGGKGRDKCAGGSRVFSCE